MVMAREDRKSAGGYWVLLALVPVLYTLSVGPVVSGCERLGLSPYTVFHTVYAPFAWLTDHTSLGGVIGWYVCLWGATW
jgi:hypothetical protein